MIIFAGISGLVLPVRQSLYPPEFEGASRLTYYASLLNTIEINSSFYKNPNAKTLLKWAQSVPENFRFTFKLSKAITHVKGLHFKISDLLEFISVINNIGDKKGCLLVQFPPGLKIQSINEFQNLLSTVHKADENHSWKIAVEFRDKSWYEQEVFELLNEFNATIVMHDIRVSATPAVDLKCDYSYWRFHGPDGNYRGSYSNVQLLEYSKRILEHQAQKNVFIYFNNTMGDAWNNCNQLINMLEKSNT